VTLRNSRNGMFMCADNDNTVVNRQQAGPWETFTLVPGNRPGTLGMQSAFGKFVCAEPSGFVVANRGQVGEWESFTFQPAPVPGRYLVRTHHNQLLFANPANDLAANIDFTPGAEEAWEVNFA
jgi:hypothetical protein